jgi:hypothetical protein
MSRWATQFGLSLAAFALMVGLGAVAIWLVVAGLAFAGAALFTGIALYLAWIGWNSRSGHAWR